MGKGAQAGFYGNFDVVAGTFTINGSGVVSGVSAPGSASISRSATGVYDVLLDDRKRKVVAAVVSCSDSTVAYSGFTDSSNTSTPKVSLNFVERTIAQSNPTNGGIVGSPTTPSAQTTGAAETLWNVNIARCIAYTAGGTADIAAEADHTIHDTTQLVASGESCVAAIVADYNGGSPQFSSVKGSAATTGTEASPSDSAITTALGHSNWVRLADCTVNRTADTTLTQSEDNSVRLSAPSHSDAAANPVSCTVSFILFLE